MPGNAIPAFLRILSTAAIGLLTIGSVTAQSINEFPLTDFSKSSVDQSEILSGGPPRDGIPPLDAPKFVTPEAAKSWLADNEPVVSFELAGEAKAYPLQILTYHEIVNDMVADVPVAVTFCPLCNASIVFDRRLDHHVLDFGTTGRLRNSDLIMYDRQTETWWQQFVGMGIIGEYTDRELAKFPSQIVSFETFRTAFPSGQVLSRETGFQRPYGNNPYAGYDTITSSPFLFRGEVDPRLPAMERVLSVPNGDGNTLVPLSKLPLNGVINTRLGDDDVAIIAITKTNSALDKSKIADSRLVPAAAAFSAKVDAQVLSFEMVEQQLVDAETGSIWNAFGHAIDGKLKGKRLTQLDTGVHFAFAWLAFDPGAEIFTE